ncbi:MAG: glycerol-3-phosphate acyltransferase, partial [Clostridia bacterium]|nr:glycerol-3-phosphate acyltransferase [Clostridia bacterium]
MSVVFEAIRAYGLAALTGYLLGSISFAIIFTWLFTKNDVRASGSGNAGATNVFRTAGMIPGIFTTFLDMAKGARDAALKLASASLEERNAVLLA